MHAPVLQVRDRQFQLRAVRAQEAERDLRGLLHDVAELTGEGQSGRPGLRVGQRGLDEEDVAARAGDGEAGGHARHGGTAFRRVLGGLGDVVRPADETAQVGVGHRERQFAVAEFVLGRDLAQQPGDGTLQVPDTGLPGVLARQLAQRGLVESDLGRLQTGPFQLAREQVVAGDDDLLVLGVTVEPDQLHPVEQGLRDGVQDVGGGEEDDVAEVEFDLQVVVAEGVVLRRVEHFEEGGGRVASEVGADLVDLVEQDDRVHRTGLLDGADDAAGERADVRAPVTADLRLVPDTAERDADELASHGVRHGLTQRGLSDSGRSDQGQHRAASAPADHTQPPVGAPLAHREVLGDAFLHVLQSRVFGVEDLLGALDVVRVLGPLGPRQFEDGVEPGPDPGALGALVGGPLQLVDLLERGLADVLGEIGGLDARPVVVGLVLRVAVELGELLAHGVELAPQQELALLLVDALLDVLGDGLGDVLLGEVLAEPLDGELQPGDRVGGLQQLHLLGRGEEG